MLFEIVECEFGIITRLGWHRFESPKAVNLLNVARILCEKIPDLGQTLAIDVRMYRDDEHAPAGMQMYTLDRRGRALIRMVQWPDDTDTSKA